MRQQVKDRRGPIVIDLCNDDPVDVIQLSSDDDDGEDDDKAAGASNSRKRVGRVQEKNP